MIHHLWQSALFTGVVWMVAFALRRHAARTRYWLWCAASLKFVVPFGWLIDLGSQFAWKDAPAIVRPGATFVVDQVLTPSALSVGVSTAAGAAATSPLPAILLALWLVGTMTVVAWWLRQWRQVRAAIEAATPLAVHDGGATGLRVLSSPYAFEPAVIGIRRPVLLVPEGLIERLTPRQLDAVIAHEQCHVRCHDNLVAALHMAIEALFWFHPLTWWIGTRLVDERERACDEAVIETGARATDYAEGILTVCRWSLGAPIMSMSGISGSDLRARIDTILANRIGRRLSAAGRCLLVAGALVALAGPIGLGTLHASTSQAQAPSGRHPQFEVTSIKRTPEASGSGADFYTRPGGEFIARNNPVMNLIGNAYRMPQYRIVGGPDWLRSDRFDVQAKAAGDPPAADMMLMLQSMLEQRFKLRVHREMRDADVWVLRVAKSGLLQPAVASNCRPRTDAPAAPLAPGDTPRMGCGSSHLGRTASGGLAWDAVSIGANEIASTLAVVLRGNVANQTGLAGLYDIAVELPSLQPTAAGPDALQADVSPFTVLREKLGLSLERGRAPVEFLVIDSVERPTEN